MTHIFGESATFMGHRGARGLSDENTLEAVYHALGLGLDAVEVDIQATRDGHAVLMHDTTLHRTTNGRGSISGLDLTDLRRVRTLAGHEVPTLEALFRSFTGTGLRFFVDMKRVTGIEEHVHALVRRYDLVERVLLDTESSQVAARLHAMDRDIQVSVSPFNVFNRSRWLVLARQVGASNIDAFHRFLSADFVDRAHQLGLSVSAWVVNRRGTVERLTAMGVDGIMGDFPDIYMDPGVPDRRDWPL